MNTPDKIHSHPVYGTPSETYIIVESCSTDSHAIFSALFSIPKKFYCIAAGGFDCACSRETHTGQECFVFVDTQVL